MATMNAETFFNLLSYAAQWGDAAYGFSIESPEKEADALRKWEAAVTIIADIWTGDDLDRAKRLVLDFQDATGKDFIGRPEIPTDWWKEEVNDG